MSRGSSPTVREGSNVARNVGLVLSAKRKIDPNRTACGSKRVNDSVFSENICFCLLPKIETLDPLAAASGSVPEFDSASKRKEDT